ncbi:MAG: hypothetical protein MZV49_23395 [Rhodopseudomonas palustris]|nr:hypothetical protein [Rhodopseudomonas palustris]
MVAGAAAIEWPVGVGAKGNEGVAGNVSQTRDAIGYVEYAYAKQNKLTYGGALINKARQDRCSRPWPRSRRPLPAPIGARLRAYGSLTDQPGEASWPITGRDRSS